MRGIPPGILGTGLAQPSLNAWLAWGAPVGFVSGASGGTLGGNVGPVEAWVRWPRVVVPRGPCLRQIIVFASSCPPPHVLAPLDGRL